ncbi:MAG: Mpo1-like protein [Planctomycetota bacterium]
MIRAFLKNYLPRHRNRVNQALHLIGVPLTFVGTPWTFAAGMAWYWSAACFFVGYALQFAGHAVEGNDAGEMVFIKKKLGLSYTEYGPRSECSSGAEHRDDTNRG